MKLPKGPYDIIYADPPWKYRGVKQFEFAGDAREQYPDMSLRDLKRMRVERMAADDALLYMWTTGPMVMDAGALIEAWGFEYATVAFVWNKMRINPGYYTLSQTEFCLVAKRGRIPMPRGIRNARQWVLSELRGQHSAKPRKVRKRIAKMHPEQRKIELFARERVRGWDAWGNEV